MAEQFTGDFNTVGVWGGGQTSVRTFDVKSGAAASIAVGDLVVVDGSNAGYVAKAANGASSSSTWVGRAVTTSTDTASADGTVEVEYAPTGLIVRGTPTTVGNLAQAIKGTKVTLDVASGTQTVDENDTSSGILTVVGYDDTTGSESIDVVVPCTYVS
ncbi:MAG: hypothetical protein DWQ49_08915 [Bacteroidetes bacterium]|nr:MAG: hypothetical protein DWQ49_08915 [Bacteroidota bacterium]